MFFFLWFITFLACLFHSIYTFQDRRIDKLIFGQIPFSSFRNQIGGNGFMKWFMVIFVQEKLQRKYYDFQLIN